jgi:hypothetical protein
MSFPTLYSRRVVCISFIRTQSALTLDTVIRCLCSDWDWLCLFFQEELSKCKVNWVHDPLGTQTNQTLF